MSNPQLHLHILFLLSMEGRKKEKELEAVVQMDLQNDNKNYPLFFSCSWMGRMNQSYLPTLYSLDQFFSKSSRALAAFHTLNS